MLEMRDYLYTVYKLCTKKSTKLHLFCIDLYTITIYNVIRQAANLVFSPFFRKRRWKILHTINC